MTFTHKLFMTMVGALLARKPLELRTLKGPVHQWNLIFFGKPKHKFKGLITNKPHNDQETYVRHEPWRRTSRPLNSYE